MTVFTNNAHIHFCEGSVQRKMDGSWRKEITKAVQAGARDEALKLLQESTEHEAVRNLCVPLFGLYIQIPESVGR